MTVLCDEWIRGKRRRTTTERTRLHRRCMCGRTCALSRALRCALSPIAQVLVTSLRRRIPSVRRKTRRGRKKWEKLITKLVNRAFAMGIWQRSASRRGQAEPRHVLATLVTVVDGGEAPERSLQSGSFSRQGDVGGLMSLHILRSSRRQPCANLRRARIALSRRKRRRLQYSRQYLRDARRAELSMHSRFRCAFECIYMCLLELAETAGTSIAGPDHPIPEVVDAGTKRLRMPACDSTAIERLTSWAASTNPLVPSDSIAHILSIAKKVSIRTVRLLAGQRVAYRGVRQCVFR
jgi:hypothetical protein